MGIPKAMMTIALIPPILKYVFGMEKKSSKAAKPQSVQLLASVNDYAKNFIDKKAFASFNKGGAQ